MLVDEAAQLGEMDEIRSALTLLRGYGVRLWTFWQDLSQLKRVYPNDWESLLTNSSTQQIFGLSNPHVRRQVNDYLGPMLTRPLSSLKPDEMVLIRPGCEPSFVRRSDYRRDAMFSGLAAANPFHLCSKVSIPRTAPVANDDGQVLPFAREER
jgi:type IV secretion system protein VirD4